MVKIKFGRLICRSKKLLSVMEDYRSMTTTQQPDDILLKQKWLIL